MTKTPTNEISNSIRNPKVKSKIELSPKMRMALGQFGDPSSVFITTVMAQANLIKNAEKINDVVKYGEDNGFMFDSEDQAIEQGLKDFQ